jgi:hypothetical protein
MSCARPPTRWQPCTRNWPPPWWCTTPCSAASSYNDTPAHAGRRRLDARGFVARLHLGSAVIDTDGGASLYYEDGGLFRGHCFAVTLGPRGGVQDVALAG